MEQLIGSKLPDIGLVATDGRIVNPAQLAGRAVFFCYPYTGRPRHADPQGWDTIPGAHGSTPQALGFSTAYDRFEKLGVKVFGVSFQDVFWQSEFAKRNSLQIPLLSDHARKFSNALNLETFKAGGDDFLKRVTLVTAHATIVAVRLPVEMPGKDAEETLALIEKLGPL